MTVGITARVQAQQAELDRKRAEDRGYKKPAEVQGQALIILGVDQVGESTFPNDKGEHPLFAMLTIQRPEGSEMVQDKLRLQSNLLIGPIQDHFNEGGGPLYVRLVKRLLNPRAQMPAWTLEEWQPSQPGPVQSRMDQAMAAGLETPATS